MGGRAWVRACFRFGGARALAAGLALCAALPRCQHSSVGFELEVDDDRGAPLPCRVYLRDAKGKPWVSDAWPAARDHFAFPGRASLPLSVGEYEYEIERGPEFRPLQGRFVAALDAPRRLALRLERISDLEADGWYAGDLHVHDKPEDMALLLQSEDLWVAPVISWANPVGAADTSSFAAPRLEPDGRVLDATAGEDERGGGALLYFGLRRPLALPPLMLADGKITHRVGDPRDEYPSMVEFARSAHAQPASHVAIEKPFWWDMPTWVALGLADSIGIAHNHMDRTAVRNHEAWGRPCDRGRYGRSRQANARCTLDLYSELLDAGIRLPPSAGSASGLLDNPLGYDRVYVHVGPHFDEAAWWRGLKQGRSFVTNGPLLEVSANDQDPGYVFAVGEGQALDVSVRARLVASDVIAEVELVRDGRVAQRGAYDAARQRVGFEPERFERSGWFLVRAITARTDTFRFASSAPFYVEVAPNPRRISARAARFFKRWVEQRIALLKQGKAWPEAELQAVLAPQQAALRFWDAQLAQANAD